MRRALLALCCVILVAAALGSPTAAAAPEPPSYRAPVEAPVRDPFRAPASVYGPGNRGLEYGTEAGTVVRSAAAGRVTFAGAVAGSLHVTVRHPDGVRTSYSFLARIDVVVGQEVDQGATLGLTAGALHFGARRGDVYFDPSSLFAPGPPRVRLVPFDQPPGQGAAGERSALRQLVGGIGDLVGGRVGTVAHWLRAGSPQTLAGLAHYGERFTFPGFFLHAALTGWQAWQRARAAARRPCTRDAVAAPVPLERRVALLVGGIGSTSEQAAVDGVDTTALGYDASDVLRFSYEGGRVPDVVDGLPDVAARAYDRSATQGDLRVAARLLADLLTEVAAEVPGVPIDLIAHSQGGVVARLALIELDTRHGAEGLERIGIVATLGTPHGGADLATAADVVGVTQVGDQALGGLGSVTELNPASAAIRQLSETSDVTAELARRPVPEGVRAVSIAARGDLVVPVPRSAARGMDQVIVPVAGLSAHDELPAHAATTRELSLALAGLPPGCRSLGQALLDQGMGEGISLVTDLAGAAGFLLGVRADVRSG